jgi:hypothetical protein
MKTVKSVLLAAAMAIAAVGGVGAAAAQDASERAGALKAWREQCSDPDTDLRTAYVEAAIATNDVAVIRICVRQSLSSDDADIRNLGLRAALASIDQLLFQVQIQPQLAAELKKAGDDKKKLDEINDWYESRDWRKLQTGFTVAITGADLTSGKSTWSPLIGLTEKSDNYAGTTSIIGDTVNWTGRAYLQQDDCHMNLALTPEGTLDGTLQCGQMWPFPVSASLL